MSLKVYLSGRFGRKAELADARDELVALGFESTARWLDGEPPDMEAIAHMDEDDVEACDVFVTFSDAPVEHSPHAFASRGGRHVEFGMARRAGKLMIVVGPREPVFHHLRGVRVFATWECARAWLAEYASKGCP